MIIYPYTRIHQGVVHSNSGSGHDTIKDTTEFTFPGNLVARRKGNIDGRADEYEKRTKSQETEL